MDLPARVPFDAGALLAFFARRAVPGVERVDGDVYARSLRLPRGAGVVELRPATDGVEATFTLDDAADLDEAIARTRVMLDLDADPKAIGAVLSADPLLAPLVARSPGRRVPGAVDGHEQAVRAVLGQQISLAGAATLAGRLVAAHGERLRHPAAGVTHLFPTAKAIAASDPDQLAMPRSRRRALLGLTAALASGEVELGDRDALLAVPGIGPWTADYIAMRAVGDRDAFLPGDLGVKHALARLGADVTRAERWRPYRAYALQHLWASL